MSKSKASSFKYHWNRQDTPEAINNALAKVIQYFPQLSPDTDNGKKIIFKYTPDASSTFLLNNHDEVIIEYNKLNLAMRMVGNLISGCDENTRESSSFEMFGIMLDCSRNAVMLPQRMEQYFVRLALMGYNMIMLYTEDTYEIADEPFFGFMRGRLSMAEVRTMDDICYALGMEMIPCIQTLGHLEQIFHWPRFGAVKDTDRVMLVDADATYELIEKMVATWKNNVRTNRIHVGMDETHDIGRGQFYDLHGDERHYDIFNRHLRRVTEISENQGMKPMIWSDMYFRMGSKGNDYYDVNCAIPDDVAQQIPANAELVYWDYYHDNKAFYLDWIERHRKLGHEPLMGSGIWTWNKFWYDKDTTQRTVVPCVQACREVGVKEIFFTMWGDDGGFCDFNSAMAGLFFAAELGFTGVADEKIINQKYAALLDKANYDHVLL
ncbi:MAG: beta-N-acetylhexosaminidase, partial [Victivallaceae bacterium]